MPECTLVSASDHAPEGVPRRCHLEHPFFSKLGEIVFRPGESDGAPVLAMALGDKTAALPLGSLRLELAIGETSPDGRMLTLIARALQFVNDLRPGDELPAEVLGGSASWDPDPEHLQVAISRIKLQLAAWLIDGPGAEWQDVDEDVIATMNDDPAIRLRIQEAFTAVAKVLSLPTTQHVVELVEDAAREFAFVEALRARLLHRIEVLPERLDRLARGLRMDATRLEVLSRVQKLTRIAVARFQATFEELDVQTGEVLAFLRNLESQRAFIRDHRDRLYGSLRAWEPLLVDWSRAGASLDNKLWPLVGRTYRFLAPRYMPVHEWRTVGQVPAKREPQSKQLVW